MRLLFHRIVILAQGFSVKVPIANVSTKSTFYAEATFVRLLFHRIVILAQGFFVKVPIVNVSAKSRF